MLKTIRDSNEIRSAQASFEKFVRDSATQSHQIQLGYQGGGRMVDVHYIKPYKFWVGLADSRNRYWNALGLGNPFRDDHSIVAEINPPKEGINRRISGAYVKGYDGGIHLAHRGRVGGGRKGVGKKAFLAWYKGRIVRIEDGDRVNEMIVVGAFDDPQFMEKLGAFTKIVSIFKEEAVAGRLHSTR